LEVILVTNKLPDLTPLGRQDEVELKYYDGMMTRARNILSLAFIILNLKAPQLAIAPISHGLRHYLRHRKRMEKRGDASKHTVILVGHPNKRKEMQAKPNVRGSQNMEGCCSKG
jgi:hypothetical protein